MKYKGGELIRYKGDYPPELKGKMGEVLFKDPNPMEGDPDIAVNFAISGWERGHSFYGEVPSALELPGPTGWWCYEEELELMKNKILIFQKGGDT